MKKVKVLRVIARLNIGGPAVHTILLSKGLDSNKFETILLTGSPEANEGDMSYLAEEKGVRRVTLPELGRGLNLRRDIISFRKIFSLISREKPDIVHTHTAKAGALGRSAALLYRCLHPQAKIKLVHTFHGHVLRGYFNKPKTCIFIWIERFLAKFTHRVIAVSDKVKDELVELGIAGVKRISVIPLGLELDNFLNIQRNGNALKDYKTVAIIGRLVPVKNHRMFLEAAQGLKESLAGRQRIQFLIVGDGPLGQSLKSYARRLGIAEEVVFTGWRRDLSAVYSSADIVALTSLNEGTPVALIEAQAAACPCVATNVGGVADVISEGESGFLVGPQDLKSFVERLLKLLYNPALSRAMGERGRQAVRERFGKERLVRDIEKVYREIISQEKLR